MQIGNRDFQTRGRTYVMGILNVTPDSFSDGGRWNSVDAALRRAEEMAAQGADLIDVGGESTRPGHTPLSPQEELDRVLPVIEALKQNVDLPVSLDTSKATVAQAGLEAGADLINDVWGLKGDAEMAGVIARAGVPCCLMHNRKQARYGLFLVDLLTDLEETLSLAGQAGIPKERIILDPGVGFAKNQQQNLTVLHRLEELHSLGCPLLLGASRKSVIGNVLGTPPEQRLEGTLTTTVLSVLKGCMFVRVHDVEENVRAIRMTEAILQEG
jgi:dihydropteroate synthase